MKEPMDNTELKALVAKAQSGDARAQGDLIETTQARLYKFCLLLSHNREIAEDLCQDTYIKAFRSFDQLKSPEAFWGWLYQIAKNLFIDLKRSPHSKDRASEESLKDMSVDSDMGLIITVQQVLSRFEPEERFLLLLTELEGFSYKEAGEQMGLSEDAIRSKLHRVRAQFIKEFESTKKRRGG